MKNIFTLALLSSLTLSIAYSAPQKAYQKKFFKLKKVSQFNHRKFISTLKKNSRKKLINAQSINDYLDIAPSRNYNNPDKENPYYFKSINFNLLKPIENFIDFTDLKTEMKEEIKKNFCTKEVNRKKEEDQRVENIKKQLMPETFNLMKKNNEGKKIAIERGNVNKGEEFFYKIFLDADHSKNIAQKLDKIFNALTTQQFPEPKNSKQQEIDESIKKIINQIKNDAMEAVRIIEDNMQLFSPYNSIDIVLQEDRVFLNGTKKYEFMKIVQQLKKTINDKNKMIQNNEENKENNSQKIQKDFEKINFLTYFLKSLENFSKTLDNFKKTMEGIVKSNIDYKTKKDQATSEKDLENLFSAFSCPDFVLHQTLSYTDTLKDKVHKTFNYFLRDFFKMMIDHSTLQSSLGRFNVIGKNFFALRFPFFIKDEKGIEKKFVQSKTYNDKVQIYNDKVKKIYSMVYDEEGKKNRGLEQKTKEELEKIKEELFKKLKEELKNNEMEIITHFSILVHSLFKSYKPSEPILKALNAQAVDFTYHIADYLGSLFLHHKMMRIMTSFYKLGKFTISQKSFSNHSNVKQSFLLKLQNQFIDNENRFMKKSNNPQEEEKENIDNQHDQQKCQIIQQIENLNIQSSQESLDPLEGNLFFSKYKNKMEDEMQEDKDEMKEESVDTKSIDTPMKLMSGDEFSLSPMTKNDRDFQLQKNPLKFSQEKQKENIIKFFFDNLNNKHYLKKIKTSLLEKIYNEIVTLKNMLKANIFENIDEGINQDDGEETILAQRAENRKKIFSTRKIAEIIGFFYNENENNPNQQQRPEAMKFYIDVIDELEAIFKNIIDERLRTCLHSL